MAAQQCIEVSDSFDNDDRKKRTGSIWTCIAHIITGVIGVGVLSLAWSTAQLGWIGGPVAMLCFALLTLVSAFLLSDCYRSPDPQNGVRNCTYRDAVRVTLGEKHAWFSGFLQNLYLYGVASAYVIASSDCIRAIYWSNCYHREGRDAPCLNGEAIFMLMFGFVQVFLSQIPDISSMDWLSVTSATMSFTYSFIGFGLAFAKVIGNGVIKGGIGGIPAPSTFQKLCRISQAIGDISYAYPYSAILIEIEDTLKSPPPENQTMKRASIASVGTITFFYLCCGCLGYAALGNDTPGNLLTEFGFYEPFWLIDFANACILLNLVGGYQLHSQPIFAFAERWFAGKYPSNRLINGYFTFNLRLLPQCRIKLFRLCFRTFYVASTTGIAISFPYLNQVLAVIGAFNFWPLAIYFPVRMYLVQKKIRLWTAKWILLQAFSIGCLLVCLFALVGSVQGVLDERLK